MRADGGNNNVFRTTADVSHRRRDEGGREGGNVAGKAGRGVKGRQRKKRAASPPDGIARSPRSASQPAGKTCPSHPCNVFFVSDKAVWTPHLSLT
ncbi:hypothetical protein E2C01_011195 [Portunus trituberculatus]|uniref:Uncharacterized protein n=1 Tax=Portunus trituberculatus TaxID=210409 RepID=A0A5B7DB32_PORTR|nr:hypothetical protein [Portunus trituberculatus]